MWAGIVLSTKYNLLWDIAKWCIGSDSTEDSMEAGLDDSQSNDIGSDEDWTPPLSLLARLRMRIFTSSSWWACIARRAIGKYERLTETEDEADWRRHLDRRALMRRDQLYWDDD